MEDWLDPKIKLALHSYLGRHRARNHPSAPRRRSRAPRAERLPEVHTNATTDLDLLAVWLKSHADGSHHTRRAYERIGRRFVEALAAAGTNLKRATVEDVQNALEAMRTKDGRLDRAARRPSTPTSPP